MSSLDRSLDAFITSFLGHAGSEGGPSQGLKDSLMDMCYSIIESNIAPPLGSDERTVSEQIQKELIMQEPGSQRALKFRDLYQRLRQLKPTRDWWPVLYYFLQCSHHVSEPSFGAAEAGITHIYGSRGLENFLQTSSAARHVSGAPRRTQNMANPHPHPAQRRPPLARRSTVSGEEYTQPPTTSRPDAYLYRRLKVIDNVTEEELIRDLIYVMQGIDGKYIVWDSRWQTFDIRPGVVISGAACDLTRRLTEVGRLYRYISEYTEAASRTGGLVAQSLCSELQEELREHYKLVAILEAQQAKVEPGILPGESSRGLTLRRLNSWITEPLQKLRLIDSIVEKCKGSKGGQMLSQIHTFTVNGDPFINSLSNRLLSAASEPFNDMLVRWITIGELVDPHEECFIREDPNVPPEDMWRNRYSINYDMIPVYMDPEITKKIFLIGKSLSFLRIACGDADWVVEQEAPLQVTERLRNPAALEAFVNPTYERVSRRLMDVLMQRYKLMEHISAMKRYLLLEQGDFFLALIEALGTQMDQPGRTHYRHNLMATVESAIRSSNAQYDSVEYLKRIDVRLPNSREARIGWDTFNLRYNLDHPLSYLVSENTLNYYSKLSFFLLRLKRVEHSLQSLWQRLMVSTRLFHRDDVLGRHGSSPSGEQREAADDARRATIKHSKIACSEMIQFIHQFERYTYLKVIEGAWDTLSKTIRSESAPGSKRNKDIGVDGWISAHNEYITSIYRTLLGKRLNYGNILTRIFETALQFCAHVSEMYDEIIIQNRPAKQHQSNSGDAPRSHIAEFLEQLNNKYRPKAATGGTSRDNSVDHDRQIESTIAKFREQACDLLRVLTEHPDTEMHFLAVSFDFNEYYANGAKGAA